MQTHHTKTFLIILAFMFSMICVLVPLNMPVSSPEKKSLFPMNIPTSSRLSIETEYNINYRMVKYAQAKQYRADNAPAISGADGVIGIIRFEGMVNYPGPPHFPGSYRLIILRNGTSYLLNVSHYTNLNVGNEARLLPGYGYQDGIEMEYVMKYNYDLTNFEPQIACQYSYGYGAAIWGKNTTNNAIAVHCINFNGTAFNQDYSYTILNPSLFPGINDVKVYYATMSYIAGKYIDSGTNIPFAYGLNASFGVATDFTNLTTSLTDYQAFDDCVISIQSSYFSVTIIGQYILTNKHILMTNPLDKGIKHGVELPTEITYSTIPTYVRIGTVFTWDNNESISYAFLTSNGSESYYFKNEMFYNSTSLSYENSWSIQRDPNVALLTQQIEPDNIFKSLLDFADGQVFYGMDTRFKIWQTWDVRTGSVSSIFFDWYIPYQMIKYDVTNPALEVWWGDSRGIWYTQFNGDMKNILTIGNSSVSHIVSQRLDVSHAQGTDSFQFTISGYLERKSNEICEIGIIPLIGIGQGDLYNPFPELFTINSMYTFENIVTGGVILRPRINFQGTGSKIIEFFFSYDSDFCPIIKQFFGLNYVAYNVYALVWERYNNGTYTQKVLNDPFESKAAFYQYSFALETGISIQDSHMLDELHFFSNGLEYSPYNVFLTNPNSSILVTDKITNDTLFNGYVMFQDPLLLPIPAKYEFMIRAFSTIDNIGLPWEWFQYFVNNTLVSSSNVRVLSPSANIVVKDFSNTVILNKTVTKTTDGENINLGLNVASIILSNQYSFTVDFFLMRNSKTIYYQLPPDAMIVLRLALGEYHYIAMNLNGTELEEKTITFKATDIPSITLGKKSVPEAQPIPTELNIIISVIAIAGITGAGIVLASAFRKTGKRPNKMPWG